MATERASEQAAAASRGGGRRTIIEMTVFGVIASALGIAGALAINWFPAAGSTQAEKIDTFWDVLLIFSVPIAILVITVVLFSVRDFRMRPGEEDLDGPPIHGNTRLEVVWTAIPAMIIAGLVTYAWITLINIEEAPASQERQVLVTGQQFTWTFEYREPGQKPFKTSELHLPEGESVKFLVRSDDVLHDFWIPAMRMKIDAVPGITTDYRITPKRAGSYPIVCAELCGLGHAFMRSDAVVQSKADFDAWIKQRTGGSQASSGAGNTTVSQSAARQLFAENCSSCHTLADADASGSSGPNLDEVLKGENARFIRTSIVDPGAEIASGYPNIMPTNFGETFSDEQLDALVRYLSEATS